MFCLFPSELIQFITSGPVIAMEILRDDAICEWKRILGHANSLVARADAPGSLRALFGTDGIRNAAHGPDSFACAARVRCFQHILTLFWFCEVLDVKVKHFVTINMGWIHTADLPVEKTFDLLPRIKLFQRCCLLRELVAWSWPG